jgi:hypothetical protein
MWIFLLAGCTVELAGSVVDLTGAPVGGATLASPGCEAVTEADGSFRVRCERGVHAFAVKHPAFAGTLLRVDASGLMAPAPSQATLRAWPAAAGLYLEPEFDPLPSPGLERTLAAAQQRFCLPAGTSLPTATAGGTLFDVHDVEWRLYRLDAEDCALRLDSKDGGTFWSPTADVVSVEPQPLAAGHFRVSVPAEPGRYAAAPWTEGFLVPRTVTPDVWEAWAFEVEG